MKRILINIQYIICVGFLLALLGCSRENVDSVKAQQNGALLNLSVLFDGSLTRLAELGSPNDMALNVNDNGLYNVGLYIYYQDDYDNDELSYPYIRNMECTVQDGKLVPVISPGGANSDRNIFIYDKMTVVAFYPYNAEMSEEENFFTKRADEANYPITRNDYSQQHYIPYRAQTNTDPTTAYYTRLTFVPRHTYKLEIVFVSNDTSDFPDPADVIILPNIDPIDNDDTTADGKRERWYDFTEILPNGGGGSHVQRFVSYIWTHSENLNNIPQGEVLLQSGQLSLIASRDITVQQDYVYRYGYNMSTGEIFLPTSSNLIHDRPSLEGVDGTITNAYQVCDIDLAVGGNWEPITKLGGRYDGGGHEISGMTVNTSDNRAGLFSYIQGNTVIGNINLIEPQITVASSADSCYVGAICGRVNNILSEQDRLDLIANLPPDLSQVVKDELLKDLLADALNSTSNVSACIVVEPVIVVNGTHPFVGSLCGLAGDKDDEGNYRSRIWASYSLGGSIEVNVGNEAANEGGYIGGFCGLDHGYIANCYTTIENITAQTVTMVDDNGVMVPVYSDAYVGFSNFINSFGSGSGISGSFSILDDPDSGVSHFSDSWPSWSVYTGIWPIMHVGWLEDPTESLWYDMGSAATYYPILQYERR